MLKTNFHFIHLLLDTLMSPDATVEDVLRYYLYPLVRSAPIVNWKTTILITV